MGERRAALFGGSSGSGPLSDLFVVELSRYTVVRRIDTVEPCLSEPSEATFYYECYYKLQDGGSLVASLAALTGFYTCCFHVVFLISVTLLLLLKLQESYLLPLLNGILFHDLNNFDYPNT